jgi:hypothetical protein
MKNVIDFVKKDLPTGTTQLPLADYYRMTYLEYCWAGLQATGTTGFGDG